MLLVLEAVEEVQGILAEREEMDSLVVEEEGRQGTVRLKLEEKEEMVS
jgi:hypothetical protein